MKINFNNRRFIIPFFLLFLSSCGGGGTPSSISGLPMPNSSLEDKGINSELYIPKENFETPEYLSQWGLGSINASSAYSLGASGKGIIIGVVDEALDWSHHEFLKSDILHPESVLTYSGNREPTPLQKFHGTATSSIIAARKDSELIEGNMHGVAFDSQILFISIELGSAPSDGEYQPLAIEKFSWEAYDTREALFYKELSSKVSVVNNSFGFTGQITDFSKEILEETFPKFIRTLGDEKDTIFVWSAGNYNGIINTTGESVDAYNPGLLAGLAYYFPALKTNNVAVVAVDSDGDIANFSNRCGVAKEFCIAAPGVKVPLAIPNNLFASLTSKDKDGFNQGVLDYLESNPKEAYLLGSGTSFSAPHVTGALAVLFELFEGNLSNSEILKRLLDSANKTGKYSDQDVYGQGLLDLGAASSPIGLPLFYSGSTIYGDKVSVNRSNILIGKSFGDGLELSLADKRISIFDAFGAPFIVKANNFVGSKIPLSRTHKKVFNFNEKIYNSSINGLITKSSWQSILSSEGIFGYRLHNAKLAYSYDNNKYSLSYGINPSNIFLDNKSRKLVDKAFNDNEAFVLPWTKASEEGYSLGISQNFESTVLQANFFSGSRRNDDWFLRPSFLLQHEGKSKGVLLSITNKTILNFKRNFIFGFMKQDNGFFDNKFGGVFDGFGGARSFYSAFNLEANLENNWNFIGTIGFARLRDISSNKFISEISGVLESNFDIGIFKEHFFLRNDVLSFRIKQDPRIEKAHVVFNFPVGRNPSGQINFNEIKIPILPSGREFLFESSWSYQKDYMKTSLSLTLIKDSEHIKRKNLDSNLLFSIRKLF